MSSCVENMTRGNDEVVEVSGWLKDKMGKEAKVQQKMTPMYRPPPPFSHRLVKKTEDGKY